MSKSLRTRETYQSEIVRDNETSVGVRGTLLRRLRKTARDLFWSEFDKIEYECPACGRDDVAIDVHHRDGDPFNNHPMNLIGVCPQCHADEHRRRRRQESLNEWKDSADAILKE